MLTVTLCLCICSVFVRSVQIYAVRVAFLATAAAAALASRRRAGVSVSALVSPGFWLRSVSGLACLFALAATSVPAAARRAVCALSVPPNALAIVANFRAMAARAVGDAVALRAGIHSPMQLLRAGFGILHAPTGAAVVSLAFASARGN